MDKCDYQLIISILGLRLTTWTTLPALLAVGIHGKSGAKPSDIVKIIGCQLTHYHYYTRPLIKRGWVERRNGLNRLYLTTAGKARVRELMAVLNPALNAYRQELLRRINKVK